MSSVLITSISILKLQHCLFGFAYICPGNCPEIRPSPALFPVISASQLTSPQNLIIFLEIRGKRIKPGKTRKMVIWGFIESCIMHESLFDLPGLKFYIDLTPFVKRSQIFKKESDYLTPFYFWLSFITISLAGVSFKLNVACFY